MKQIKVIGGGLAGCEAAWQAAERGCLVSLYEMRPILGTGAHTTDKLAELVCSNSLGSNLITRSSGLLAEELKLMGSLLLQVAEQCRIPAGQALAVDRNLFSDKIESHINNHPRIKVIREEVKQIPEGPTILASGPLTSPTLSNSITEFTGHENLFFFDAIAPIVEFDSIDMRKAFWGSRYGRGMRDRGDYINCPLNEEEYKFFVEELIKAERIQLKDFEGQINKGVKAGKGNFFEGCLPIEVLATRGENSLAFGPLRPVGIRNPHKGGSRPFAVVQLRQDDKQGLLFNMVGFQTNLNYNEQQRVFGLIPGLENAKFVRHGQMHRNTYVFSPDVIKDTLQSKMRNDLLFAGQLCGVEGYLASIGTGLLAGINITAYLNSTKMLVLPEQTMLGALSSYICVSESGFFQPMKANFGLLPKLETKMKNKLDRYQAYAERSLNILKTILPNETY